MKEKLFLIDAYALIFRAFYSMGKNFLYNSKGQNVTAIMMFTSTLHKIIKEEKPDKIAVVFDHKSQNIRVQEFEYYKAHRDETPEDIKISEPYIRAIIEAMNIPILEAEGYEADDVIGTIAKQSASDKLEVYMVTPDKDFAQLVQENIYIYKPGRQNDKAEILDVPKILEKWEIKSPNQVIDILALWGDAVDNIPGIPGIGEKTSKKLIAEFGSIENLIANAHELKGKQKDNVIEFAQQGLDSKKLATIITNVPIEYSLESMNLEAYDKEKLKPIFVDLEFRNLSKEILGETLQSASQQVAKDNTMQLSLFAETEEENTVFFDIHTSQANYQLLYPNTPECDQVIQMALEKGIFCFDTETTGLDYFSVKLLGISLCYEAKSAHYITLHENTEDEKKEFLQKIKGLFSDAKLLIAQNLKFDRHILESYEIQITCPVFDTMLAHFLVNSDAKHSMDAMAKNILKYIPMSYASLTGSGKSKITLADVALDEVAKYAAEDADITYQLKQCFRKWSATESSSPKTF
ncbi:MAG: hypothetical protein MUE53_09395 [Chitinophagales bacterium]|nr:hypothetical protein [Chitinophagales bacterium]